MPSPSRYSSEKQDDAGNTVLVISNPGLKEELNIVWNKTLNSELAEWTKYESLYKSLFSTVIGQIHDKVLSTCKLDKTRWTTIEQELDLVSLLKMVEKFCNQNSAGNRVFMPANNLVTIEKCLNYKQRDSVSNTEFAKEVNTMYINTSVIHQNGEFAFGTSYYDHVMNKRNQGDTFSTYVVLSSADKIPIDKDVQELIVSILVIKGCNHNRARTELTTQYSLGTITDATYPATEEAVITLLDSVKRGNDNSNNKAATGGAGDDAVIAAHDIEYIYDDDYSDEESTDEEDSVKSTEEADEATLMADSVEDEANADTKTGDGGTFMAAILANVAAAYDEGVESIENNFINRIDKQ
jgi:hypothetical protein